MTGQRIRQDAAEQAILHQLGDDVDPRSVAALYAADHLGIRDATLGDALAAVLATEHVPCVSALRYKESGLRKRARWEQVWELQRSEDRTGEALGIPLPPKFSAQDSRSAAYWSPEAACCGSLMDSAGTTWLPGGHAEPVKEATGRLERG
ncbi:DUF7008 domain-containing protein [Streptomyces antimycoticus]|uniref:DUF7008 domain-containing protein n=1 Tax=Streptomyces antimycoticus TaxID=68175 RepID=UPI00381E1578